MRVVVTGGAGFIGSHVVERLRADHAILVVDSKRLDAGNQPAYLQGAKVVQADIRDPKAAAAIRDFSPHAVVHLAAQVSVTASMQRPVDDIDVNLRGLANVFMAARDGGAKTFVFASSGGAIYGDPQVLPATEQTPAAPASVYGLSKRNGEDYLNMLGAPCGMRCVNLRFANVYGPRQASHGEGGVVAIFTRKMMDGLVPTIFGDGQQTRDFVFVKDVAAAVDRALASEAQGPFNIASNSEISLLDLTELLRQATGFAGEVTFAPGRAGEVNRSRLSYDKATEDLGWRPQTTLFAGLLQTVQATRQDDLAEAAAQRAKAA